MSRKPVYVFGGDIQPRRNKNGGGIMIRLFLGGFILPGLFIVVDDMALINGFIWNDAAGGSGSDNLWINRTLPADYMRRFMSWRLLVLSQIAVLLGTRISARTLAGGRSKDELHGSARWAEKRDVKASGLFHEKGVVVGGWPGMFGTQTLRHDGPEHVLCFAPTRSGKGIGLVLPTLLSWQESVLVLDIKGENYALTAGYRASLGHKVIKFEPTNMDGSHGYNPLAEIRIGTGHVVEDCQNIAMMIIDPDGKGFKNFFDESGLNG